MAPQYDAVMLAAVLLLLLVGLARLAIKQPGGLLTAGLLAISAGYALSAPIVDRNVDTALQALGVANVTDVAAVLCQVIGWWTLGVVALRVIGGAGGLHQQIRRTLDAHRRARTLVDLARRGRSLGNAAVWWWTVGSAASAVLLIVTWAIGDVSEQQVNDAFELSDAGSRMFGLAYCIWLAAMCTLVVLAAILGLRDPCAPRAAVWFMLLIGVCGLGYVATGAVLMAAGTLDEYVLVAVLAWGVPALLLLSAVGAAGPVATVRRQLAARRSYADGQWRAR
ncbi:hypothetical protein ACW2Q0_00750 [Nocardia sp. R16R-3T]